MISLVSAYVLVKLVAGLNAGSAARDFNARLPSAGTTRH
jgi:hypothetical protein